MERFITDLLSTKWETIFDLHDIDEIIIFWNSSIIKAFDLHAPYITARITKKAAPWWTDNLKLMKKLKNRALLRYKKYKTVSSLEYYKSLRNYLNSAITS
nr:unnamed protein product [Callosobruchus chinensis]